MQVAWALRVWVIVVVQYHESRCHCRCWIRPARCLSAWWLPLIIDVTGNSAFNVQLQHCRPCNHKFCSAPPNVDANRPGRMKPPYPRVLLERMGRIFWIGAWNFVSVSTLLTLWLHPLTYIGSIAFITATTKRSNGTLKYDVIYTLRPDWGSAFMKYGAYTSSSQLFTAIGPLFPMMLILFVHIFRWQYIVDLETTKVFSCQRVFVPYPISSFCLLAVPRLGNFWKASSITLVRDPYFHHNHWRYLPCNFLQWELEPGHFSGWCPYRPVSSIIMMNSFIFAYPDIYFFS